ncbi:flagellar basal body-associated FliL family protein [Azospirillum sp. sgz302134]
MAQAISRVGTLTPSLDRISGKVILLLLALVIGLSLASAGGLFLLKPRMARAGLPGPETTRPAANYASLPAMNFTLTDGDRLRELRVRVVLEMEPLAQPKTVVTYAPRIASAMNVLMLDVNPAELRGKNGPYFIKDAVMQTAAKEMQSMKVRQVLVQEMVMR